MCAAMVDDDTRAGLHRRRTKEQRKYTNRLEISYRLLCWHVACNSSHWRDRSAAEAIFQRWKIQLTLQRSQACITQRATSTM